jgi:hypothetical protein
MSSFEEAALVLVSTKECVVTKYVPGALFQFFTLDELDEPLARDVIDAANKIADFERSGGQLSN